ncbi:hypothetical protein [Chania multitudinisentens]|uniref:hypothetical protein n=1 Tax=Chania multitudinisentens TaxID=1639108 RepID=UPI0004B4C540|nr:hypothetical protein [Chania multitudinisentens]
MEDSASIGVNRGHLTFNGEGDNIRGSRNYSRMIHYPNRDISGVTIGRGYDMGNRSQSEIFSIGRYDEKINGCCVDLRTVLI